MQLQEARKIQIVFDEFERELKIQFQENEKSFSLSSDEDIDTAYLYYFLITKDANEHSIPLKLDNSDNSKYPIDNHSILKIVKPSSTTFKTGIRYFIKTFIEVPVKGII